MKKRSKLFLIVAGIIVIVGILVCLAGVGIAANNGEQLYAAKMGEEDRGYTYEFGDGKTDKVKINVSDADVNVYGNSDRSYVEVINFNENLSSYVGNNAMVTFTEAGRAEDMIGNLESILSFKGLRYILRATPKDRAKTINIYLADDEHVKAFDINIEKGNVRIENISTSTDFDISLSSGKINLKNIETDSSIEIEASGAMATDIRFDKVKTDSLSIVAKRASFISSSLSMRYCEMKVTAGGADFAFVPLTEEYSVDISTKGKLTVDSEVYPDRYKFPEGGVSVGKPDEENQQEPSALVIAGDDFTVKLSTPEGEKIIDTEG